MRLCALLLIVSSLGATPLVAQSLAEVARKEAERRQSVKESGKSYSNKDLQAPPAPSTTPGPAPADKQDDKAAGTPDQSGPSKAAPDAQVPATDTTAAAPKDAPRDQAYWSKRLSDLREQLARDQVYMDALQSRINALTTDFVNRDNPVQRNQIAADRQRAIDELARLKKGTEQDKKAITDLEEEARHAGVPPGWLR